jgi:molecular chaperone DnaK (HSP70)
VCAAAGGQQQQAAKELVVGIDLGTTNSAVACIKKGKPVCLPNKHGDTLTPSVVHFGPDGEPVVGKEAKKLAADTTYYSVKRLIGRAYSDPVVQEEQQRLAYKVRASLALMQAMLLGVILQPQIPPTVPERNGQACCWLR